MVYRGVSGMALPAQFWRRNDFGVRGGIEAGFMSTSSSREVAAQYASSSGVGFVIELQQGMVSRGASLRWISQYPHEAEILFNPLTGLEVRGTRIEGALLVLGSALPS